MPLPLGHAAIGLATYETVKKEDPGPSRISIFLFITILANLPDVDVLVGLLTHGNGSLFHRGPTHSLAFALASGLAAANLWRLSDRIPRLRFSICFGLVLSHVLADMVLTSGPVSFFWPLQVYWSTEFSGWSTVIYAVLFQSIQDGGILVGCAFYMATLRILKSNIRRRQRVPAPIRRR